MKRIGADLIANAKASVLSSASSSARVEKDDIVGRDLLIQFISQGKYGDGFEGESEDGR
jgi:hypothetical protein